MFQKLRKEGLTCYLDSSGFFEFEAIRPLIDVTDKFLFDLKGEGLGLQSLCFDRQNRQGIVPQNIIPTHQHIKQENLDRNLKNLAQLLPLNKVEEVRLVYVANFFDAEQLVEKVASLLKNYQDVLFKIIRMHTKGARDTEGLSPYVPTVEQTQALENYAKSCGLTKIVTIL